MPHQKTIDCIKYINELSEDELKRSVKELYQDYVSNKSPDAVSYTTFWSIVTRGRGGVLTSLDKCYCDKSSKTCPYCQSEQRKLFQEFVSNLPTTTLRPSITKQSLAFNQLLSTHNIKPLPYPMYRKWLIAHDSH